MTPGLFYSNQRLFVNNNFRSLLGRLEAICFRMNIIRYFLLVIFSSSIYGCADYQAKKQIKSEISNAVTYWHNRDLIFPDSVEIIQNSQIISVGKDNLIKNDKALLTFIDGGCQVCLIDMKRWNSIQNGFRKKNVEHSVYFVIGNIDSNYFLKTYYPEIDSTFHIIFDNHNEFRKFNKISNNKLLQTFLIDRNKKVKFIGNPSINNDLVNYYITALSTNQ